MKPAMLPFLLLTGALFSGVTSAISQAERPVPGEKTPNGPAHVVEPGDCALNEDGVEVCNDGDSEGDMSISPKKGNSNSETTVDCDNDAQGTVSGIDSNDTVNVTSGCNVTITGTGGTVSINGSGASATVTNNGPAGGGNITVNGPGGTMVTIPPGNTATVST